MRVFLSMKTIKLSRLYLNDFVNESRNILQHEVINTWVPVTLLIHHSLIKLDRINASEIASKHIMATDPAFSSWESNALSLTMNDPRQIWVHKAMLKVHYIIRFLVCDSLHLENAAVWALYFDSLMIKPLVFYQVWKAPIIIIAGLENLDWLQNFLWKEGSDSWTTFE